jgi:hypothetical protein
MYTFSSFQVREIALSMTTNEVEYGDTGLRWQSSAILALQEATEAYLVHLFEDAYVICYTFQLSHLKPFTVIYVPFMQSELLLCSAIYNLLVE